MKLVICILLILFFILKFNFIYQIVHVNYNFYVWKRKYIRNNPKNIASIKKKLNSRSAVSYYQNLPLNQMRLDVSALYESEIVDRTYNPNYINSKILGKKNSLPHKINYFTTPVNIKGNIIGDSIFRIDLEDRLLFGTYDRKEAYLSALQPNSLEKYRKVIKKCLETEIISGKSYHLDLLCHKICTDLFYRLHFNLEPNLDDYEDINMFIEAIINFPFTRVNHKSFLKQVNNLKSFYQKCQKRIRKLKNNPQHCILNFWLDTTLSEDDIFIELIHNILAMVVNWFNTIYPYLLLVSQGNIPKLDNLQNKTAYIHECFRFISPVRFASSLIKNPKEFKKNLDPKSEIYSKIKDNGYYMHLYDIKSQNRNHLLWSNDANKFNLDRFKNIENIITPGFKTKSRCPFQKKTTTSKIPQCPFYHTSKNAKLIEGQKIYEEKGYLPFGDGYRRCPGEFLSMIFLEELVLFIQDKKINISLINNKSIPTKYIWDIIETNYEIIFN